MSDKTCLIIDDNDQMRVFDSKIKNVLQIEGFNVDCIHIKTTESDVLNDESNIDSDKLFQKIRDAIKDRSIDIVATDYDLSDDKINGMNVISIIRTLRKKVPIILYSGKLERVINDIIGNTNSDKVRDIKNLMRYNITEFVERTEYPNTVNRLLKEKKIQTDALLVQKLRQYSDLTFKSCYPQFIGYTLGNVATEIEKQTPQGRFYQDALFEQIIAYMVKINEDDNE